MGMAAGGMMEQKIFADTYGLEVWDLEHTSRTFVHLFNSMAWRSLTGMDPPMAPRTAADYARHNLPWFTHYDEGDVLGGTKDLIKVKSVAEIEAETGMPLLPENEPCAPTFVVKIQKPGVSSGTW